MLRASSHKVRAVAGLYLAVILERRRFGHGERVLEEPWVSEALWELAGGGDGLFRQKCISGLAACRMRWAEFADVWLREMATASGEGLQVAWCSVVEHGGCGDSRDREALAAALLRILSSGNTFPKEVRRSALIRLHGLVPEMEAVGFNQEALGLPLSRRGKPMK
jgi:hypothetical protein